MRPVVYSGNERSRERTERATQKEMDRQRKGKRGEKIDEREIDVNLISDRTSNLLGSGKARTRREEIRTYRSGLSSVCSISDALSR